MNQERMYNILLAPHYSEKSTVLMERANTVVFKVARDTTKPEIKKAVEEIFKVTVESVRTLNVKGKRRRTPYGMGRLNHWKKAHIRLAAGQSINLERLE